MVVQLARRLQCEVALPPVQLVEYQVQNDPYVAETSLIRPVLTLGWVTPLDPKDYDA